MKSTRSFCKTATNRPHYSNTTVKNKITDILNSLPNDKILDLSQFKAFADDNLNVYQKLKFALGRVENIVGKGENIGNQHFLLFPTMFSEGFFLRVINPFPHHDTFWHPWDTSLLKTLWEKEKLLVMSSFSFFYSVFYLFWILPFSSNSKLSSANSFSLEESKICCLVMV